MSSRLLIAALALLAVAAPQTAIAEDARIRIVFFTPSDVDPPANCRQRMKDVVDYAQAYYGKWLRHWGYEPENVLPVDREEDGTPVIYFVKGDKPAASGAYDKVGIQGPIREQAIAEHDIPRQSSTFWLFVYGTKLRASRGWGGHGDRNGNGLTLLVWHDDPGELPLDAPLAGGLADRINLKGYLHELGHTMSLPHFGPLDSHNLGMSLMGPNARSYRGARKNREERVYITPAVAAIIWKQPQMTGRFDPKPRMPKVEVPDFAARHDARRKRFVLTGTLKSDLSAHSIVAIDLPDQGPDDYWKKAYAARVDDAGRFELTVDELSPSSGELKIVFCFENGIFTGKGTGVGFRHAAVVPYEHAKGRYRIPTKQE
ncbi:hypothetical protein [Maioricimonas sp. JC845]|uniref:hypothetical protein n=1 Tax=Maioricimonas sp. JC845 TaxID=3232138 RepID=UPI00345A2675